MSAALQYWKNNQGDEFGGYMPDSYDEVNFLRAYDPKKFPVTMVTVDTVILRTVETVSGWEEQVLLIKRKNWPYKGFWALPGGFMDQDETAAQAAAREVQEEAGLWVLNGKHGLWFVCLADTPGRDPRGRAVSMVFKAVVASDAEAFAGDDAVEARWFSLDPWLENHAPDLAFDHSNLIAKAIGSPYHA